MAAVLSMSVATANDPTARDKLMARDFDNASKQALDLLRRDAAKSRPDWMIVATAGAAKWDFQIMYLRGKNFAVARPIDGRRLHTPPQSDIVAPQGASVVVNVTSNVDIHPFVVPGLAIDKTAMPGRLQSIEIDTTKTGVFPSACSDPCDTQAKGMVFAIHVVDMDTFRLWFGAREAGAAQPTQR